jgi:hypothetical protein
MRRTGGRMALSAAEVEAVASALSRFSLYAAVPRPDQGFDPADAVVGEVERRLRAMVSPEAVLCDLSFSILPGAAVIEADAEALDLIGHLLSSAAAGDVSGSVRGRLSFRFRDLDDDGYPRWTTRPLLMYGAAADTLLAGIEASAANLMRTALARFLSGYTGFTIAVPHASMGLEVAPGLLYSRMRGRGEAPRPGQPGFDSEESIRAILDGRPPLAPISMEPDPPAADPRDALDIVAMDEGQVDAENLRRLLSAASAIPGADVLRVPGFDGGQTAYAVLAGAEAVAIVRSGDGWRIGAITPASAETAAAVRSSGMRLTPGDMEGEPL